MTQKKRKKDDSEEEDEESEDEEKKEKKKHKKSKDKKKEKKKHKKKKETKKDSESESEETSQKLQGNEIWVEKSNVHTSSGESGDEEDNECGPQPKAKKLDPKLDIKGHGANMLPGEADAIASFVQQNKRIPRRGEVGLTSDEIEGYENLGYVMSGSRHKRMNAVRIRKENQIYSAEEKRALLMFNYEEKVARESEILSNFKELVSRKFGS